MKNAIKLISPGRGFWPIAVPVLLITAAFSACSGLSSGQKSSPYVITGSGTSFTAVKNGETVGKADQPVQEVINAIKTHAAGENCCIQFGSGLDELNIGTASVDFDDEVSCWGIISLLGKICSAIDDPSCGTVYFGADTSINSEADIKNTAVTGNALYNASTGVVNINSGTVSAADGKAVYNASTGVVNICGGMVSSTGLKAVYSVFSDAVNISGGTVSTALYEVSTIQ